MEVEGAPYSYVHEVSTEKLKLLPLFFGAKVLVLTAVCGATHLHGEGGERGKKKGPHPQPPSREPHIVTRIIIIQWYKPHTSY
jgi:hypothetical protein